MNDLDPTGEGDATVFRDVLMLTLLGFVTIVVLLLPHLNPPAAKETARPAGNVVVEARWGDGLQSDVDLWVMGPGDRPVGYSRKNGVAFDLLRDDLGLDRDLTNLNYEFAFSHGAPAGEYIVNLHLFRLGNDPPPITVSVVISLRNAATGTLTKITSRQVTLRREGGEVTVQRFRLDAQGSLVPGSLNQLPRHLRNLG